MTRFRASPVALMAVLAVAVGLPAAAAAPAAAATTYTITDLGSLGGGVTHGLAINASGQVTGDSVLSKQVQVQCPPQQYGGQKKCFANPDHAFLWSNGTMADLGALDGGNGLFSQGVAINDSGQVVGPSSGGSFPGNPFLWNGHKMIALRGTTMAQAYGINGSGLIAGQCGWVVAPQLNPCVVSNGTATTLPECGGIAVAINNNGQVIGDCGDNDAVAVLWTNDTPTVLGTLGGGAAHPTAINNMGQVAGTSQTAAGATDGFLYSNGTMTDLGSFTPAAINDHAVMVGGQFVDSGGTVQNLNNLIPAGSPYQIESATGINDNGQIVANATDTATGQTHALLLNPS